MDLSPLAVPNAEPTDVPLSWEILIIVLSILASGLLAAAEMALSSARRSRLEEQSPVGQRRRPDRLAIGRSTQRRRAGDPRRRDVALHAGGRPRRTRAGRLLGATTCPAPLGAAGGIPRGDRPGGRGAGGCVPRCWCWARLCPSGWPWPPRNETALAVALPIATLARVVRPLVWLVDAAAELILSLLGPKAQAGASVSVEDIEWLLRDSTREGILEPSEQLVASRALHLGDRAVKEIMRPRVEIDAIDVDTPPDEVIGAVAMAGFSRLPVHEGDLDHILGFVYTKDLLAAAAHGLADRA